MYSLEGVEEKETPTMKAKIELKKPAKILNLLTK